MLESNLRATGTQFLYRLRASYWFVPSIMALGSIAFSVLTLKLDDIFDMTWLEDLGVGPANTPEAARSVLSAIAGSMITVAGVTFSMTILSVSFASAQFGPRLVSNFMRDRGNQITLGTFIAAYIYCLLVLRRVRGGAPGVREDLATAFVPQISVTCGIGMAIASVGVLIYFIHHVPETIDASNITARVGRELQHSIDRLFPRRLGEPAEEDHPDPLPEIDWKTAKEVNTGSSGYLQAIDTGGLLAVAVREDLVLRLWFRPGDFAHAHQVLLQASPAERVTEEVRDEIRSVFAWGSDRTPTQNALFLVDQLVEIIVRALSPGVNDPFTAIGCLRWLERSLMSLAEREAPSPYRFDESGHLRVIAQATRFEGFCEHVFGQIRQYVAEDRNVTLHSLQMFASLLAATRDEQRGRVLLHHLDALAEAAAAELPLAADRDEVRRRQDLIHRIHRDPGQVQELREVEPWIGGSA